MTVFVCYDNTGYECDPPLRVFLNEWEAVAFCNKYVHATYDEFDVIGAEDE